MWLSIVGGVLALLTAISQSVGSLVAWIRESNLKQQGTLEVESKSLKEDVKILEKAIEAREETRTIANATPASASLPDDGFRRD